MVATVLAALLLIPAALPSADVLSPGAVVLRTTSWAPPPRVAIDTPVTVQVEGTIVDALRAVSKAAGNLYWLCGIPPNRSLAKAHFSANSQPLWKVLDRLAHAYGYEWGVLRGSSIITLWPRPAGLLIHRSEKRPETEARLRTVDSHEAVRFDKPTPLATAVRQCWRPHEAQGLIISVHPDLEGWKVVGVAYRSAWSPIAASAAAASATAIILGAYRFVYVRPGPLYTLASAFAYLKEHPEIREQSTQSLGEWFRVYMLTNHFTAQHHTLLLSRLPTCVAFWELSPKEAALFVELVTRMARDLNKIVDFSRAHEFRVEFTYGSGWQIFGKPRKPGPKKLLHWFTQTISCQAPLTDGSVVCARLSLPNPRPEG